MATWAPSLRGSGTSSKGRSFSVQPSLGAAGLSDIGHYFPDTDPAAENINSQKILCRAADEAARKGYYIVNIDAAVIAEAPKIGPHLDATKSTLAHTLKIEKEAIGIKATTNERIGELGQGVAIAAQAVCLLAKKE